MAVYTYRVLAQSSPAATTNTDIYTAGAGVQTIISTITVCNRATSAATYRISIRPNGTANAAPLAAEFIAYDATIAANDTIAMTLGLTLNAADIVTVYASSSNLSIGLFGSELS
jgi:hypothetical protein